MPVSLASNALTTLEAVKADLKIAPSVTTDDEMLTRYINAASTVIESYCGRSFARATGIIEPLAPSGTQRILLDRTPVVSIASITDDSETVDADDYEIENASAGIVFRLTGWPIRNAMGVGISREMVPGTAARTLLVTYTGGFILPKDATDDAPPTLPPDIEDACIALVSNRYRNRGVKQADVQKSGMDITPVEALLADYRRIAV